MRRRRLALAAAALLLAAPPGAALAADPEPEIPPLRPPELDGSPAAQAGKGSEPPGPEEGDAGAMPRPSPPKDAASQPPAAEEPQPEPAGELEPGAAADAEEASDERPGFDRATAERCELELRAMGAAFELREPLEEPEDCGAERPLELLSLPGGVEVLGSSVLLRCETALALARWVKEVVVPSAVLHLGAPADGLMISTTYQCRDRGGGTPSQHAYANALDVMGVTFSDDSSMLIQERPDSPEPVRAFQAAIRGGACAYFTTVLGPTTNAAHGDHMHLDLKQRRGGYRICQ